MKTMTTELIPAGTYRARARGGSWGLGVTSTGKEQVGVLFDLLDLEGRSIPYYGYFTEKTFDRTIESLRLMGWQGSDLTELNTAAAGLDTNEVNLVIEHEAYEGVVSAKVKWVNALGGGAILQQRLEGDQLKSFAQRMKAQILASAAGKPPAANGAKRATPPRQPEPPPHTDADIPF